MIGGQQKRLLGLFISTLFLGGVTGAYFYLKLSQTGPLETELVPQEKISESPPKPELDIDQVLQVKEDGLSQATVVIQTSRGKIKFKFYTHDAPVTSKRIATLIQKKFYDGIVFHRVVPGFVIQTGDPTGTGNGGSGELLNAEFNSRKHIAGTVAMARAMDPNSADSQFYISLGTHPHLDGQYTVFGQVVEGQDVANQIQQGDRMSNVTLELN